jgi:hypothetical protein
MKHLLARLLCLFKGHDYEPRVLRSYDNHYTVTLECMSCGLKKVKERE